MRGLALLTLAIANVLLGARAGGEHLVSTNTPLGILHLEFAWTRARALELLATCEGAGFDTSASDRVRQSIHWDFGFLVAYGLGLWFLVRTLAAPLPASRHRPFVRLALGAPLAAALDAVENLAMLQGLANPSDAAFRIAAVCAAAKFLLLAVALGTVVTAIIARVRHSRDAIQATPL